MIKTLPSTRCFSKKTGVFVIIIAACAGIFAAAVSAGILEVDIRINSRFIKDDVSDGKDESLIGIVNGEEIYKQEYKDRLMRSTKQYRYQGVNVFGLSTIQAIKNEVILKLINDKILLQYAKKANLSVSDGEVEEIYGKDIEAYGSEENLVKALESLYLSVDEYRDIVRDQLTIDKYLRQTVDLSSVSANDEEVQAGYGQAIQDVENPPSFEESAESIKQQIIQMKTQRIINNYLNSLLKESSIDLFL